MTTEELWELIEKRLDTLDAKLDSTCNRSKHNQWNIRLLWGIVTAEAGIFGFWIKSLIRSNG